MPLATIFFRRREERAYALEQKEGKQKRNSNEDEPTEEQIYESEGREMEGIDPELEKEIKRAQTQDGGD